MRVYYIAIYCSCYDVINKRQTDRQTDKTVHAHRVKHIHIYSI